MRAAVARSPHFLAGPDALARAVLPALARRSRRWWPGLLPAGLEPDVYEGSAWIGVVPFRMTGVGPRGLPRIRRLADFGELNVRTYTTLDGKPGVWFFSLDATQPAAVRVARADFHLPYLDARIELERDGETIDYSSERTHLGGGVAELRVRYRPTGPVARCCAGLARELPHRPVLPLRRASGRGSTAARSTTSAGRSSPRPPRSSGAP